MAVRAQHRRRTPRPSVHQACGGKRAQLGGVLATDNAVIPYAVGVVGLLLAVAFKIPLVQGNASVRIGGAAGCAELDGKWAVSFLHVGIGSGHRARPNGVFTEDRFYALRDYAPFDSFNQAYYDNMLVPITDAGLQDITNNVNAVVPAGSPGWRFELRTGGGWIGENLTHFL